MIKPSKRRVGGILEEGRRSDNQTDEQHSSDVSTNTHISNHALLRSVIYPDEISSQTKLPSNSCWNRPLSHRTEEISGSSAVRSQMR